MIPGVSSWFIGESRRGHLSPKRRFLLGGSDYSDWVLRWPTVTARLETVDLGTAAIALSNIGGRFNPLVEGGTILTLSTEIALGLTHPASGDEWMALHTGQPSHVAVSANGAELRLEVQGKTRRLTDLALGSDATSAGLDYTGSAYYPADLAWYLVTSHGGLSAVASVNNPDLEYAEWSAWRAADQARDIRVKGYLTGEKIYQVLGDLAKLSSVGIGYQQSRVRFADLYGKFSVGEPFAMSRVVEASLELDPGRMVNYFFGEAAYNPATGQFAGKFTKANSDSQARFGVRAARFSPRGVWFATGDDGRYVAEDEVRFGGAPRPVLSVRASLAAGLHLGPGDVVSVTYSHMGLAGREMRIMTREVDLRQAALRFELLPAAHRFWELQQQVSSHNLTVRTLAAVDSGTFVAIQEAALGARLHRSDPAGEFQPMTAYGTALLVLNVQELIIGGPPTSGSFQSVLQRSSDSGSSSTVVASLGAGTVVVHDIFQVLSGTCLAATTSGGIVRSTDAGSSWSTTWTVSPGFHVRRFFQPLSGTLWGGTGVDNAVIGKGTHVWESTDAGVTWVPRATLLSSGAAAIGGFYALSDSQYLLATMGTGTAELNTYRVNRWAPGSLSWTVVAPGLGFAHILRTTSGHLLLGFNEEGTLDGGTIYRSTDNGSSWLEDARLAKQGNIELVPRGGSVMDAFISRMSGGARTFRYRAFEADPTQ